MISADLLKTIINNWDPIQLLSIGSPLDEYTPEIDKILRTANQSSSISELEIAHIIHNVFLSAFGEDVFLSDMEECLIIARQVCSKTRDD